MEELNPRGLAPGDTAGKVMTTVDVGGGELEADWATPGGVSSLDDLDDVDTTTDPPEVGDQMQWDGTNWVPMGRTSLFPMTTEVGGEPLLMWDDDNALIGTEVAL